jgi:hypothetical protein
MFQIRETTETGIEARFTGFPGTPAAGECIASKRILESNIEPNCVFIFVFFASEILTLLFALRFPQHFSGF